jgi:hypothetical protein
MESLIWVIVAIGVLVGGADHDVRLSQDRTEIGGVRSD